MIFSLILSIVSFVGAKKVSATHCSLTVSNPTPDANQAIAVTVHNAAPGPGFRINISPGGYSAQSLSGVFNVPGSAFPQSGKTYTITVQEIQPNHPCQSTTVTTSGTPGGGGGGDWGGDGNTGGGTGCTSFTECLQNLKPAGLKSDYQSGGLVGTLLSKTFPIVLGLGGFGAVIIILISAFQFVTSSGNPESAAAARGRLIFALIGFVILALAFAILQIVDSIFLKSGVI